MIGPRSDGAVTRADDRKPQDNGVDIKSGQNLRQPSITYLPPLDPNCGPVNQGGDGKPCPESYQINAGDAVYQGIELGVRRRLGASSGFWLACPRWASLAGRRMLSPRPRAIRR